MDENNMMQNFMAAMGVMSNMMSQFSQPPAPNMYNPAQPTSNDPIPNLGPGYGYGGSHAARKHSAPAPAPPPPPQEDIPLPPSYNYPRFLEPEMEKSRKIIESESSGWSRKTDEELAKEKELSKQQKSLIAAAERAAKINKKLTGYEQTPVYNKSNVPDPALLAQDRPLTNLALTYIPTERNETTGITNVPFVAQKEVRRQQLLKQKALGVGAYGPQSDSIRGAPMKWEKRKKPQREEKVDWKMTNYYRELTAPVAGSLTFPEPLEKAPNKEEVPCRMVRGPNGDWIEMARNDPHRPAGLYGTIEDEPGQPDEEDLLLDREMRTKPKWHFHSSENWYHCVNGVRKEKLTGKRSWERGFAGLLDCDSELMEKLRVESARKKALQLLEKLETEEKKKIEAQADTVIGFIENKVQNEAKKIIAAKPVPKGGNAMIPPPISALPDFGYHNQDVINRTDILTWTSKKGHTNQVSNFSGQQIDHNVAIAGKQQKREKDGAAMIKRKAPLNWNFVKEGAEKSNPAIGPQDPSLPNGPLPSQRARFVPDDIDPNAAKALFGAITKDKCDICSKSFQNNESARNSHFNSEKHKRKLNNWLKDRNFPAVS